MTIYRGPGGGGSATTDSELSDLTAISQVTEGYRDEAQASAVAAAASANDAASSATQATTNSLAGTTHYGSSPPAAAEMKRWVNSADGREYIYVNDGDTSQWVELSGPSSTFATASEALFTPAGTGAVARTVQAKLRDVVSVTDFGAVADYSGSTFTGTDNTAAFQAAIDYCESTGHALNIPGGSYYFNGGQLVIDQGIVIQGAGRDNTVLVFGGAPTKTVRTYAVWRSEYDSGNYSASSDAAIACAFVVNAHQVFLRDFYVQTPWDSVTDHPLPFNSATDYPTSGYDNGILIQKSDVTLERVLVGGPWGLTGNNGGIKIDGTQPSGAVEHIKVIDCESYGRWGLVLEGPHGQPTGGNNYADLASSDTRGAGGWSDFLAVGSQFYDSTGNATHRSVRLTIGGVAGKRVRRFATDGGTLFMDGQAANSAKRAQQVTFLRCRFGNADYYTMFLNYCNRTEFIGCHTEYRAGYYLTDGVTVVSASDSQGRYSTVNAQNVVFTDGEKSGEPDNLTYKDTTNGLNLVSENGLANPTASGLMQAGRMFGGMKLRDIGQFTPAIAATSGAGTYSTQAGFYARVADLVVVWGRIDLTRGTLSGNISITGLPYTCANYATAFDPVVTLGLTSYLTYTGRPGGLLSNNTKVISLINSASAAANANLTHTAIDTTNTTRIDFFAVYATTEP